MIQWDLNVNRKTPITNMFKFVGPKPGKVVRISDAVYNGIINQIISLLSMRFPKGQYKSKWWELF